MSGLFDLNPNEMMCFFAVLVRMSTFFAVMPFFGERAVPVPVKILLSLAVSVVIFPALVARGWVRPADASGWSTNASGLIGTVTMEALFGLAMGYVGKLVFDGLEMGGEIIGNLMGLGAANQYDPFQESQAQVLSQFQMALAMLLFLVLDGHHLMLRGMVDSYRVVGLGDVHFTGDVATKIIAMGAEAFRVAVQVAAPMLLSTFCVNIVYGILSKAMPQMNILVASFSISALVGLVVMFLSLGAFHDTASNVFSSMGDDLAIMAKAMSGH